MSNTEYIKKLFNFENYVIEVLGLLTCYIQSLRNQYSINRKKKCIYLSSCCINCQIHPDSSLFQFLSPSAAVPQINIHWPLVSYNQTTSALYSLEPIGFYRIALSKKKKTKTLNCFISQSEVWLEPLGFMKNHAESSERWLLLKAQDVIPLSLHAARLPPDYPIWRADSLEKTLMLGKTEGRRRRGDRGWDGWMASLTWVWASSRRERRTGKPGMQQSTGWQTAGHDWVTEQQQNLANLFLNSWLCHVCSDLKAFMNPIPSIWNYPIPPLQLHSLEDMYSM